MCIRDRKYVKACCFWAGFGIGKHRYIWHTPSVLHFGDWVAPDVPKMSQWQARSKYTATASLCNTSGTLAKIARILGKTEDAAKYKELTAADDTASAEQPAELPLDDLRTEEAAKPDRPFDWTIVWMGAGILAALGIIVLLWKWFSATKQARRRNDE